MPHSPPFRLRGGFPVPPCPPTTPLPALFGTFAGTTPMSDSPAASVSGLRPQAFPDRPQGQRPTGSHWGLPVLAHRASAHAQGLRLRGAGPPLASGATARVAFPTLQRGRRPGGVISELNGWPVRTPADASPAMLPPPAHDTGPWWLATPSMSDSFIPYSMPVYPGAFCQAPCSSLAAESFSSRRMQKSRTQSSGKRCEGF